MGGYLSVAATKRCLHLFSSNRRKVAGEMIFNTDADYNGSFGEGLGD